MKIDVSRIGSKQPSKEQAEATKASIKNNVIYSLSFFRKRKCIEDITYASMKSQYQIL